MYSEVRELKIRQLQCVHFVMHRFLIIFVLWYEFDKCCKLIKVHGKLPKQACNHLHWPNLVINCFLAFCTKAFWVNSQLCTLRDNFLTRRFFCSFFSGLLLHFWDSLSIVLQWKLSSPFCLHFSYSKCFLWNCQVAREESFLFSIYLRLYSIL